MALVSTNPVSPIWMLQSPKQKIGKKKAPLHKYILLKQNSSLEKCLRNLTGGSTETGYKVTYSQTNFASNWEQRKE